MPTIRLMQESDLDEVRAIDAAAFDAWWKGYTGSIEASLPLRTYDNVLNALRCDPEGCFVATLNERVIGFIFSRTWGAVGFFGPFGILPEYHGLGLGQQLVRASLDYLCSQPRTLIGIETMPESPYNLGFYLKLGFRMHLPLLVMTKHLTGSGEPPASIVRWSTAREQRRETWLADLRTASNALHEGMDYSKEIISPALRHFGDTMIQTENGTAVGAASLWIAPVREVDSDRASIQILFMHPDHTDQASFKRLLTSVEGLAYQHGKRLVSIPVGTAHQRALQWLMAEGYQVERSLQRMVLEGSDQLAYADDAVDLVRMAG
jgi:ribosomal protein S18 acetylase RimI-like enzyme